MERKTSAGFCYFEALMAGRKHSRITKDFLRERQWPLSQLIQRHQTIYVLELVYYALEQTGLFVLAL